MQFTDFNQLDLSRLPSPCFVVDEVAIKRNLGILNEVQERSGAKVLHALKAFSLWHLAPLTTQYLSGTCSSGLYEAKLAQEFYHGEIHVYSAGFSDTDLSELLTFSDHIVFNSLSQLLRFETKCRETLKIRPNIKFGLRINPEHSETDVDIYNPCAVGSRLGITYDQLTNQLQQTKFHQAFELISGLHFHTLCEQEFLPLQRTLYVIERKFAQWLPQLEWLNFGGGHHITRPGYDIEALINCIKSISKKYRLQVYLEPGEAVALGSGILTSEVLDIAFNALPQAILDTSATCHIPDTLEMPYRPHISNSGLPNEKQYTFRLGGLTCLAGDIINDYSFDSPLEVGQRLIFEDMAHYTMVKTTMFNGTQLPAIAIWNSDTNKLDLIREFDYSDFRDRLS
ncbi:MAG: carboxynorspermidine decarboxylase [Crocinitomicaceae bacterium]|jgi:carboxynorspermidine decarboxylase